MCQWLDKQQTVFVTLETVYQLLQAPGLNHVRETYLLVSVGA